MRARRGLSRPESRTLAGEERQPEFIPAAFSPTIRLRMDPEPASAEPVAMLAPQQHQLTLHRQSAELRGTNHARLQNPRARRLSRSTSEPANRLAP